MIKTIYLLAILYLFGCNSHYIHKTNDNNLKIEHKIELNKITGIIDTICNILEENKNDSILIDTMNFKSLIVEDRIKLFTKIKQKYNKFILSDSIGLRKTDGIQALYFSTEIYCNYQGDIKAISPCFFFSLIKIMNGYGIGGIMYTFKLNEKDGRYILENRKFGGYLD
jgi:hypothetical protein